MDKYTETLVWLTLVCCLSSYWINVEYMDNLKLPGKGEVTQELWEL